MERALPNANWHPASVGFSGPKVRLFAKAILTDDHHDHCLLFLNVVYSEERSPTGLCFFFSLPPQQPTTFYDKRLYASLFA